MCSLRCLSWVAALSWALDFTGPLISPLGLRNAWELAASSHGECESRAREPWLARFSERLLPLLPCELCRSRLELWRWWSERLSWWSVRLSLLPLALLRDFSEDLRREDPWLLRSRCSLSLEGRWLLSGGRSLALGPRSVCVTDVGALLNVSNTPLRSVTSLARGPTPLTRGFVSLCGAALLTPWKGAPPSTGPGVWGVMGSRVTPMLSLSREP